MRSLLGSLLPAIRNDAPVPYVTRSQTQAVGYTARHQPGSALGAMAEIPALFPIVSGNASAVARVQWHAYRKAASGKREDRTLIPDGKHLSTYLLNRPNRFFYGALLRETIQQYVELTGMGHLLIARTPAGLPYEAWPVRPDRMVPVPDRERFLAGWVYVSPDGERVPLDVEDVIPIRQPDPEDIYGGLAATASMATDLDTAKLSATWNRNFFLNDASPGGLVLFEEELTDDEFRDFRERWQIQHQGVSNAGRVALLEKNAKWQDRSFSLRDMQFKEMRELSAEMTRQGYAYPKHLLGQVDIGNRATAEAQNAMYGQWQLTPKLDRWKGALNHFFLPLCGPGYEQIELDYDDPVPEDADAENASRDSRVTAAVALIAAGADPAEVFEHFELPAFTFSAPEPAPAPAIGTGAALLPSNAPPAPADHATRRPHVHAHHAWAMTRPQGEAPGPAPDVDLSSVQQSWLDARDRIVAQWATISDGQREELVRQVRAIIDSGQLADLAAMTVSSATGAALLAEAMTAIAQEAGQQVTAEAALQGEIAPATMPPVSELTAVAGVTAALLAAGLAVAAAREALRVHSPDTTGRETSEKVADYLRALPDTEPRKQLGVALTGAQNAGRLATFEAGPIAALYANEVNDSHTCAPCHEIDGRWLGNSANGTDMEQINRTYPIAGYVGCIGTLYGNACRGTVTGVWRSKTTGGGA